MTQLPPLLFILPRFVFILFTLPPALYLPLTHTLTHTHTRALFFHRFHSHTPTAPSLSLSPACTSHALLCIFFFIFSRPRWSIVCPVHETRRFSPYSRTSGVFVLAMTHKRRGRKQRTTLVGYSNAHCTLRRFLLVGLTSLCFD